MRSNSVLWLTNLHPLDRSHLKYSEADKALDYRRFRHEAQPGDFQLESLHIEDFLSTIYQPNDFRPYTFSIFQANIGQLRKQWLFYDLLSAESITGQVDNCLYSLHKPQSMRTTSEHDIKDHTWKRMVSDAKILDLTDLTDLFKSTCSPAFESMEYQSTTFNLQQIEGPFHGSCLVEPI